MIRHDDGRPWLINGVGAETADLKTAEQALQDERHLVAAILDSIEALVVVLDPGGRIVQFNRACERASGRDFAAVRGRHFSELFESADDIACFDALVQEWCASIGPPMRDGGWITKAGERRTIAWSGTVFRGLDGRVEHIIANGNDVTERQRLERALLEVIAREQRRIGQDLHDGLGQHLTGTAFMSKALQQRLDERSHPEAAEAGKIVKLVNEAIQKTRELSRGLVPVDSPADGLMASLRRFAAEVEHLFSISCRFVCDPPVLLDDGASANHLFHIAQEAVTNAVNHGQASRIVIALSVHDDTGRLTIDDDGGGISSGPTRPAGMGLHIMRYRANMIGGSLDVRSGLEGGAGTIVNCRFPMRTGE